MNSRKDNKGRKLRDNETYRKDGRYCYRYTDIITGKRKSVYAGSLLELREKEKALEKDIEDNILTDMSVKKLTLNGLFDIYMETKNIADSTRANYINTWNNRVKDEIGNIKVVQMLPSHIRSFYAKLSRAGYSHSTIKLIHNLIYPSLELAVDDDIIRKNPAKKALGDYGSEPNERTALTVKQQCNLLDYARNSNIYNLYTPMLTVMVETGLRCGELIGLTWNDIDMKKKTISVNHQLTYRNYGDGCKFHICPPKTDSGVRVIPMTGVVKAAFEKQRELNFMLGIDRDFTVDDYKGFIFTAKTGRPLMPAAVNNVLYNVVNGYNAEELKKAKKEHRKAELLPKFSAHVLRHTACTRMAEKGIDIKVLQYIMGHSSIDITMQVYNHITDITRIENEVLKLEKIVNG
ncbi:MAG: site-specific integrase [Lachnospira sp.]|nr:site-specific integrase [Lachnospira sp.]